MKFIVIAFLVVFSFQSNAASWITHDNKVKQIDIWPTGSDEWGIKIRPEGEVHANCSDGFYIPHDGPNKGIAYSSLLTAFSTDMNVKIQYNPEEVLNGSCKVNRLTLSR